MCKVSFWILGTYCELVSPSTCAKCIALCVKFQSRYSAWRPWRSRWPPAQMTSGQWPPNYTPPPPCSDPQSYPPFPLNENVLLSDLMFVSIFPSFLCRSFVDSVHPIDSLPLSSEPLPDESLKHFQCSKTEPLFPPIPLRDEKVKVLKAVPELSLSDVVLGQVHFQQ